MVTRGDHGSDDARQIIDRFRGAGVDENFRRSFLSDFLSVAEAVPLRKTS